MTAKVEDHSPLLPHHVFVMQLRAEADVAQRRVTGWVKHVVSGQVTHFDSLEDLLVFLAQVLGNTHSQ